MEDNHTEMVKAKVFPGRTEEIYEVPFAKTIFIEETDFKEQDEKGYHGLAPGKSVMLRYAYPITCRSVIKDATGIIKYVECTYDSGFHSSGNKPPKGVLAWIAQPSENHPQPIEIEARLYNLLFAHERPGEFPDDAWLDCINPESEIVIKGALGNSCLRTAKAGDRFQFERLGYFCVDSESTGEKLVVNRTVTMRDSIPKELK